MTRCVLGVLLALCVGAVPTVAQTPNPPKLSTCALATLGSHMAKVSSVCTLQPATGVVRPLPVNRDLLSETPQQPRARNCGAHRLELR